MSNSGNHRINNSLMARGKKVYSEDNLISRGFLLPVLDYVLSKLCGNAKIVIPFKNKII